MHILFLTDNFPPETNAPASRTFEHAKAWVDAGHDVTVVTCAPNFPKGKVHEGYRNRLWQSENMAGIKVIRVWTIIAKNEGFGLRILDYLSYMVCGFLGSLFVRKPDVVVGTSPQFFTVCAAWAVAALKRRPFVFELRDIWPESIRAVGAMESSKLLDFFEKIELFLYRKAHSIVAVTHRFKENLISRGVDGQKINIVTNGVDRTNFNPLAKDEKLQAELALEGKFVAGYVGTHGMAHALDTVIDAAKILEKSGLHDEIRIIMLGDGASRAHLQDRAQQEGVTIISFIDSVSKDEVKNYWSLLDVSIIHLSKNDLFKQVIPSKLFECMGMGIPVLHGVQGESAEIVTNNQVGLVFEPENAESLAQGIVRLRDDDKLRLKLAANGIKTSAKYDRLLLAEQMLRILKSCTDIQAPPESLKPRN
ncbi:glycosyltransferase family 4 protein [Parasphingorhabdus sp.]|uniref:glycosyltransferase family 4 protein n=1 Tax=Parasphingorhabdus sp. TaxID=2709688 RepID=UPI003BB1BE83